VINPTAVTFDASAMTPASDSATNGAETFDALTMLRDQVEERDESDDDLYPVEVPGIGWRLMCDINFPYSKYAAWQSAALPKSQRNGRRVNVLKLDQTELAFNILLNTCTELQYRRNGSGEWEALTASDGSPLLPSSDALLRRFNVVDPRSFLRKLYGREARLVEASQKIAAKAGWVEGDDDDEDPTD
jgi:hypothetical protein